MNEHEMGQVATSAAEVYAQFFIPALFVEAGAKNVVVETRPGKARFKSMEAWIYADIKGWTLADVIDDSGYEMLEAEAPRYLSKFQKPDGSIEFESPAHLVAFTA